MSGARGGIGAMTRLILDRTPAQPYRAPVLDDDQLRVVNHVSGAMRVLAGPGTGKTTTLVAAMAARLTGENALQADQVLGLTFGRRAALDWRDQVTAAVGGGVVPLVSTFHSFCYALVRKFQSDEIYTSATRLLSGPEQQVRARQLFGDAIADGRLDWPEDLLPAVGTRGLAEEIRAVMSRTRSHIMDPEDLVALGRTTKRQPWEAIGVFMNEYLDVLDAEGVLDYSELIHRAVLLSHRTDVREYLHKTFKAIYVDEYQDTDPGQVALLKSMVNADSALVVVGDVDQAIYGFRGADESGIRNFPDEFAEVFGAPVQDVVLSTCRRFGSNIRSAASAVVNYNHPLGFNKVQIEKHRNPSCTSESAGEVLVQTFDSDGAQASHIADLIARAHATRGLQWSDFAVIVRSAVVSIPTLYRAFVAAGIPVEVAADEIPLHQDPAVAPLVTALRVIDNQRFLTPDVAQQLLTGPLCGIDPVDLRRFGRSLRAQDRSAQRAPKPAMVLVAESLNDPDVLSGMGLAEDDLVANSVLKISTLFSKARSQMQSGASPHEVLWTIWQGTSWPEVLQRQALGFGAASTRAHRDLDAICSLFDLANRFVARGRGKDLTNFLDEIEAQEIPAEALAENDVRNDSVRLLTAHRSKGLQWKFVVVADVQEELWPDLRVHQTLLQADRIGPNVELMPATLRELLAEERRLFYVALTRAMETVVVTATDTSTREDGIAPSRFVADVLIGAPETQTQHETGRPTRPLSIDGVISGLRRTLADESASSELRKAAAVRLATLAKHDSPMFAHANPDSWWGVLPVTENIKPEPKAISISASAVSAIEQCPAQWFLEKKIHAVSQSQTNMVFGNALHAIAQSIAVGDLAPEISAIDQQLDRLWPGMGYEAQWENQRERSAAHDASVRLLSWLLNHSDISQVTESDLKFVTTVEVAQPNGEIREVSLNINGRADRIEFSQDGVIVYDFKTSRNPKKNADLVSDVQLALYSYLISNGTHLKDGEAVSLAADQQVSGAALIQLRNGEKDDSATPIVQRVAADQHDAASEIPLTQRLGEAALVMVDEQYEARYEEQSCKRCPVRILCPAVPEGKQVL
jgi:superfamily I DNA/RNA helicase/RecB family exonuclease